MPDCRHILAGLAAVPATAALPGVSAPADPLAALWAGFQASRADLFGTARTDEDWTTAMSHLATLQVQAIHTAATSRDGAVAAVEWARDEYADRLEGVTDLDTGERLILAMLDAALAALRTATPLLARRA